ncbi:myosin light chain kinase 3 isoform X3 [Falco biarmicus]|uniref:myosin light chain kinase 3 isoform X3 n=1 Tax=Falco cherrug TaxID=345164 RepID=UPI00188672F6|nr:myosin light chain kinase 3 isoform X3 [Falco cherrug]XP_037264588.1 myosin light chain kinase 3 isoform X3 [Falco rusticolus]XP_056216370.1 myosin light chain kinase 3 isoform X3 [Falco biarmicus]
MSAGSLDPAEGNALTKLQPTKVNNLSMMDKKLNLLNEKMDKLLHFQEDLTGKLQRVNKGIDDVEKGINELTVSRAAPDETDAMQKGLKVSDSAHQADIQSICSEVLKLMKAAQLDASKHKERLAKIEKRVDTLDKVITFVGEVLKNSKVVDFILKGVVPWKKGSLLEILVEDFARIMFPLVIVAGLLRAVIKMAKDKSEESGAKPKHVLSNRGTQTESKKALEETRSGKKLDENEGACEKVNTSSTVAHKAGSKAQVKERTVQQQVVEGAGKTHSSKSCQQQKDVGVKALNQHNGLPLVNKDHVDNQNVPAKAHDTDRAPRLDECHEQLVHQKLRKNENKPPSSRAASREAVPSASHAVSDAGCEVTHTRISVNMRMTEMKEKIEVTQEGNLNDLRGKSPKVKSSSSTSAEVEGAKQLPDKLKLQQSPKIISTEPKQEVKGDNKQNELAPRTGKQQTLLSQPKPGKKAEEKSELKRKPTTSQSTSAKEPTKEVKIHQETAKAEESPTDTNCERREPESASSGGSENAARQCTGTAPEEAESLEASKEHPTQDEMIIDDSPSPPAPFEHRIVSVKQTEVTTCYSVCHHEVLGGGRFGQVHKCTEISTGLNLAAKIIKVKGAKEREEVKNEINIMNQLNHVNLIQLYDAFEARNNITLIMEYLDGGELFDRITDENYNLTELDAILFTKQICEGVHFLHQHYILHLDLKPENILCVNHTGNQIKIIDFGLARRYKPREKLKVNFGTPEFLAPEVVNYDFVSFPTDMWSVGVITYMLLSGLSPFLGETDAETMNYVVNCSWDFDAEAFEQLSEEAKDFISRLLVKEKSCRMSATQCLKHEWLNDLPAKAKKSKLRLKSQLLLQSYMAHRKWKKHFYVVAAANRLKRFQSMSVKLA